MNPYKVLNIPQGASTEEIREAYFNLVNKYSLDQSSDENEKRLFLEKVAEANEAFRKITVNLTCEEVRDLIEKDDFILAESKLNLISDYSSAEWNYLKGILQIKKGWIDSGYTHIQKSVDLNPYNDEYVKILNEIKSKINKHRSPYTSTQKSPISLCQNKNK